MGGRFVSGVTFGVLVSGTVGVAASILLPILAAAVRRDFPRPSGNGIPEWIRPYIVLLLFSLVAAAVCLFWWANQHPDTDMTKERAFLIGFAWETIFEKLSQPPLSTPPRVTSVTGAVGLILLLVAAGGVLLWLLSPA